MASGAPLQAAQELFRRGEANAEGWSMLIGKGRRSEAFAKVAAGGAYRRRFATSPDRPR